MSTKFDAVLPDVILLPPPGRNINWPSDEGKAAGVTLADLFQCPDAQMCGDCVFRKGSFPNQCVDTLDDAMKCLLHPQDEGLFVCNHREDGTQPVCGGYAHAIKELKKRMNQ